MQTLKHLFVPVVLMAAVVAGCERKTSVPSSTATPQASSPVKSTTPDPLAIILAPHEGDSRSDKEIRRFQEQTRNGQNRQTALERLGWAYVAKARESFDPGYYKLAEACANVLESDSPRCAEGLLLRGHVFQNLHCFKEAEPLARELVAKRGLSFDHALLGDTLMEQGRLKEAVAEYQAMVDLRPDLQSYSRVAHIRWLTGDRDGAIEMMQAAVSASSPNDPDSAAWVNSQLAKLQLQSGDMEEAKRNCEVALEFHPNYPPALLLQGKMQLAQDEPDAAVADLERATQQNPLPEYQWTLAEALRAAGREQEAAQVESTLRSQGAANDPRTFSLYLATRGENAPLAVELAEKELQQREDVFTHDALAWALTSAGRIQEAKNQIDSALAEGTVDARLYFHAAAIYARAGNVEEAQDGFASAASMMDLLLPSEREQLMKLPETFSNSELETTLPSETALISTSEQ